MANFSKLQFQVERCCKKVLNFHVKQAKSGVIDKPDNPNLARVHRSCQGFNQILRKSI